MNRLQTIGGRQRSSREDPDPGNMPPLRRRIGIGVCDERVGVARKPPLANEPHRVLRAATSGLARGDEHVDVGVGAVARPTHESDPGDEEVTVAPHCPAI